jgi:hypothetical protein
MKYLQYWAVFEDEFHHEGIIKCHSFIPVVDEAKSSVVAGDGVSWSASPQGKQGCKETVAFAVPLLKRAIDRRTLT